MKNLVKYTLAVAASAIMFAACDLNLVPNSAVAYEEGGVLIQTSANLKAFETGILSSFRGLQMGDYINAEECQFDCFNAVIDYGNNFGPLHRCDYTFTSSDYDVEDMWAGNYSAIKNYNIIIASADNVPENLAKDAKVLKGEAFFFRACSYLTLARHFGPMPSVNAEALCVPLVLKYDQNEKPFRAKVGEVYAQIKSDLDSAAVYLAGVKGSVRAQKPSIDAVNAVFARYFIDMKDYANAAKYAHFVIDTKTYKLASTQAEMTKEYVNDEGTEAIYQVFGSKTEGTNACNYWTQSSSNENGVDGHVFRPYYLPTKTLVNSYESKDLRFTTWFDNTQTVLINGIYYNGDFYTLIKYWGNPSLVSSPIRNGRQLPKPFKIGEMYLIAAEAELSTNPAQAKIDLNTLQAARGASLTDASTDTVRKEWYKETVGEGLRMSCLKRWGIGFNGRPAQDGAKNAIMSGDAYDQKVFEANSIYFQWPVPSYEMKINSNMEQNPGYDEI